VDSYQNLAKQVGSTTTEIAKLSVYFFRQGLAQKDALAMTEVAATAAKVASIDATESANFLTSAINGFGMASSDAMGVSDKFAALGASSASSYEELAIALSKVAPVAKVAGVDIDQMMGFIAKGVETTREAPENIGTAFKTIFARMTQLTDFGKTLEDGMSVNKVEEALALAGVALRDEQGNFRNMGDVITELGYKFDGLDRNTQSYIATAMAGTRQQSRLLAVLQNFDRTMELVDVSQNSAGATMRQHADYTRSMEAAMNGLTTSFQMLVTRISDSQAIIDLINTLSGAIDIVGGVMGFMVSATDSAILNTGIFISSLMALSAIFLLLKSRIMGFILSANMKNAAMKLSTFLTNKDIAAKKLQILLENIQTTQIKKSTALILLQVSSEKLKLFFKKAVTAETLKNIVASMLSAKSNKILTATNFTVGGSAKFAGVGLKAMAKGFLSAAFGL
jgi:TP901 family phage tail tape measure protein